MLGEIQNSGSESGRDVEKAILKEIVELEHKISDYSEVIDSLFEIRSLYGDLQNKHASLIDKRKKLGAASRNREDEKKLRFLQNKFVSLLESFGFSSFSPKDIEISNDTYLPSREGFDVNFDVSASDNIRVVWSYVIALMLTSREFSGNHPGFIVLDEPRQQEANAVSFSMFLKKAAVSCGKSGQIILATSEDEGPLKEALGDTPHFMVSKSELEGKLIEKCD